MDKLSHFNNAGHAKMVDVSDKESTVREAVACGCVFVNSEVFKMIRKGNTEKGDVFGVAQVAGIMAAKRTSEIIPMCHPVTITGVDIAFDLDEDVCAVNITATVRCKGETGVEMEALTAVSATALTIYDMCKSAQKDILLSDIKLLRKTGGKSGNYIAK